MSRISLSITMILLIGGLGLPMAAQSLEPVYKTQFNEKTFEESGWSFFKSGADFDPASVSIGLIPISPTSPDYSDGRGVVVTALSGQGSFIYGPAIATNGKLVLLRLSVLAMAKGGTIAVGALNTQPGGSITTVNGSVSYAYEADSGQFTSDYQFIHVLYRPQNKAIIPIFQLAVTAGDNRTSVTAMFDNFEVYLLDENTVADPGLRTVLGISGSSPVSTPTPISPSTPTPPAQSTPTVTPTPTATPVSGSTPPASVFIADTIYTFTSESDTKEAFNPNVAFDQNNVYAVVAADLTGGYQDINLRHVDSKRKVVDGPFTVNQTFEDTVGQTPDIAIDFSGTRHVVWSDNRSVEKLFSIYLAQIDSFGNRKATDDFEVNNLFESTNTAEPALSVLDNGDLVVCWRDDRNLLMDLFARRLHWSGSKTELIDAKDFQINIPFKNTNVAHPDIVLDDQGTIMAVWSDDRVLVDGNKRNDIYARIFNMNTAYTDTRQLPDSTLEVQVSAVNNDKDNATNPKIALQNGYYMVVWKNTDPQTNDSFIHAAVLKDTGDLAQSEFIVDSGKSGNRSTAPSIAPMLNDKFLITWQDGAVNKILGRIYDPVQNGFIGNPAVLVDSIASTEQTSTAIGGALNAFMVWDAARQGYRDIAGASLSVNTQNSVGFVPVSVSSVSGRLAPSSVSVLSVEDGRDVQSKPPREPGELSADRR